MRLLLDTNILLWLTVWPERLSSKANTVLERRTNELWFSTISLLEVALKFKLNKPEFQVEPKAFRAGLLHGDFTELDLTGEHIGEFADMPKLHSDPFDRLLVAQAKAEGMLFITSDRALAPYGPSVRVVV